MNGAFSYASFLTLEYVTCLAQECHFSKAAKELCISQSALSQHILGLEKRLRVQLFDRSVSPLRLTAEGKIFVQGAQEIIQSRNALWRTMSDFADFRRGEVVLGTTPVRSLFMLPKVLAEFAGKYPQVQLTAKEATSSDLEAMVLNDVLDLAVLPFTRENPEICYETLYVEKTCLYVPSGFMPPDPKDLKSILQNIKPKALILLHSQTRFGTHINKLLRAYPVPAQVIEVSNYIIALSLVAKGVGISFAPDNLFGLDDFKKGVTPLPLELEGGVRKVVLIYRKKRRISRAAKGLITIIKKLSMKV